MDALLQFVSTCLTAFERQVQMLYLLPNLPSRSPRSFGMKPVGEARTAHTFGVRPAALAKQVSSPVYRAPWRPNGRYNIVQLTRCAIWKGVDGSTPSRKVMVQGVDCSTPSRKVMV